MTTLPEGWSPTADINWGQTDEEHFRHYMQLLIETYIAGGNEGEPCSVMQFAVFIIEQKGWDDAYRWIYKDRTPEEKAEAERYWRERQQARMWKGGTGGRAPISLPGIRLAPAEPYAPPEPVTRVDLTKTDPARTDPGGDGAAAP